MAKAFRGPKAGSEPPSDRFDQILVAAAALIYERGYHATSLRDIAAAVDIKAASIYYHFSNKQELLVKIMSRTMDDLIDAAHDALMIQSAPQNQLAEIVRSYVQIVGARASEGVVGDIELRSLEEANRALIVAKRDQYEKMVQGVLEFGRTTGVFAFSDAKFTAFSILGMCNHVGIWYRPSGRLSLEDIASFSVDAAMRLAGARIHESARINLEDLDHGGISG